jgi:hypothetical protein
MKCSEYVMGEHHLDMGFIEENWKVLCRCPICKGFLPRYFPMDKPFTCKKCKTELMVFPEVDEEGLEQEWGKICPLNIEAYPSKN